MKRIYLLIAVPILLAAAPAHAARCTGDAYCRACKTCEYCKYCNSGGHCGVCTPSMRNPAPAKATTKKKQKSRAKKR